MRNKELTRHINDRVNGEGHQRKHVDWRKNGFIFTTYTRNSADGDPNWHPNKYIDICAISIAPDDQGRHSINDIKRIHQHKFQKDVDEYISLLESWATQMNRELRFTEFGADEEEVLFFKNRGYSLRYGRGRQGIPWDIPAKHMQTIDDRRRFWYVEAYKKFSTEENGEGNGFVRQ